MSPAFGIPLIPEAHLMHDPEIDEGGNSRPRSGRKFPLEELSRPRISVLKEAELEGAQRPEVIGSRTPKFRWRLCDRSAECNH